MQAIADVLARDEESRALVRRAGAGDLALEIAGLLPALGAAAAGGRRVRLVYTL